MRTKIILTVILSSCLAGRGDGQPAASPTAPPATTNLLALDLVIQAVLADNAAIKAARAKWEAMKQRVPQARAWEDLRVGLDATAGRFVTVPPNSFADYRYTAEQTLPLSGKNRWRAAAASAEAVVAFEDLRRRQLDLVARARAAYFRLANAYTQLDLNGKNEALLKQFAEISRAKYEVGKQSQAGVLLAETDLAELAEARFDFQRQIDAAESQLNVLMNRPAQPPLGRPASLSFLPIDLDPDRLQKLALAQRPELVMAQKQIDAAQARWEAARREWVPEPSFRIEASQYNAAAQTISELTAGFSINVPWFNRRKYKAGIAETRSLAESAQRELEGLQAETLGLVRDQLKKIQTFHHHSLLFRDRLVPLAQQSVKATQAAYETDQAGFLELIIARRNLQQVESTYGNHLADYHTAVAELEALIGADPTRQPAAPAKSKQESSP